MVPVLLGTSPAIPIATVVRARLLSWLMTSARRWHGIALLILQPLSSGGRRARRATTAIRGRAITEHIAPGPLSRGHLFHFALLIPGPAPSSGRSGFPLSPCNRNAAMIARRALRARALISSP